MLLLLLFSCLVMPDSLLPYGLQHARLPCPLLSPGVCSNSCPLSQWCHPTISPSIALFSSCPQAFPASAFSNESALRIRWPQYWSFSFSTSPSNEYSGLVSFKTDWSDLRVFSNTTVQNNSLVLSFMVQLSDPYMTTGKPTALTVQTFVGKVMFLLFNMLSRFVITFLPRSKRLLISRLQSLSRWFWSPRRSVTVSTFSSLFAMKWWDWMPWSLCFECSVLSQLFHSPLSPSSRGSF